MKPLIMECENGIDIDPENEYDGILPPHTLELFKGDAAKATDWLLI